MKNFKCAKEDGKYFFDGESKIMRERHGYWGPGTALHSTKDIIPFVVAPEAVQCLGGVAFVVRNDAADVDFLMGSLGVVVREPSFNDVVQLVSVEAEEVVKTFFFEPLR